MAKKKKRRSTVRTDFRKRQSTRTRKNDLTRRYEDQSDKLEDSQTGERVSGKGRLTRKRTVAGSAQEDEAGFQVELEVDEQLCKKGRVISVHGLGSFVRIADGTVYRCTVRGVLKSLATDLQHVVVAGAHVAIQVGGAGHDEEQAVIVRVDARRNQISRTSRKRQQVLVSNVDFVCIVASAAEPLLKPNLIDRYLISAEKANIDPIIVINNVLLTSTETGLGIERLKRLVSGRDSVVTGQSGVGKSSLLNVIEPGLQLRVGTVSDENQKGRHTTTAAKLIPLENGGHLIDTPGIRQFQLWDVIPEEVSGYFRDLRPFINGCRFPDCTHTHEDDCAVKWAVADGKLDVRRYESYVQIKDSEAF